MTGVFGVVLGQILLMFLYLIIGYVLYRTGLITQEGSKALAHLLLYCVLPCVVLKSFCIEYSAKGSCGIGRQHCGRCRGAAALHGGVVALFPQRPHGADRCGFFQRRVHGTSAGHSSAGRRSCVLRSRLCGPAECFAVDLRPGKLSGDKKYIQLGAVLKNPLVLSLLGGVMIYFLPHPRCRRSFAPPWGPLRA